MVSTLADGLFLRRCAEFVTRATIEHYLLTDSSSARQLAARQGVGKIKHLSAKILWIQNLVQEKAVILSQISTIWNVADAGTKVLSSKRLRLLLHQLGVFLKFGDEVWGRRSFKKHLNALVDVTWFSWQRWLPESLQQWALGQQARWVSQHAWQAQSLQLTSGGSQLE